MNDVPREQRSNVIPDHSVPLISGQRFHHQGANGVVYFKLSVEEMEDGSLFPMTETALACNILPIELDDTGSVVAGYFLSQKGRPEMGLEKAVLKTAGSFCNKDESTQKNAIRSLHDKLGIEGVQGNLIFTGTSYGFGAQFRFPIDLYLIKDFTLLDRIPMDGCTRVRMTLDDIANAQKNRTFFNSESIDLIATILLRNGSRDTFSW